MSFFDENVLLGNETAKDLYRGVRDLPILDCHSHLDPRAIAENEPLGDLGELWLRHDHYKWRAMRLCGVDERYITGDAPYRRKFAEFARIMPLVCGNPVYYFCHFELKHIFGITEALSAENADRIYEECTEKLAGMRVSDLLARFRVRLAATTDDPADSLEFHGVRGATAVVPTFRPDKYYCPDDAALARLGEATGREIGTLGEMLDALTGRLRFFVSKGCFMSDHGFERFPAECPSEHRANELFARRASLDADEKSELFGFILRALMIEYRKLGVTAQLHFAVRRNVNREMFSLCGADSGFDVIGDAPDVSSVERFLASFGEAERPEIILYTLNDTSLRAIAALCGAFRGVRVGAAWWFNDTKLGIRRALETVAEYGALGTFPGMLTDSRSFAGYSRFDFFRRILCGFVGELVDRGEYTAEHAKELLNRICLTNVGDLAATNPVTARMLEAARSATETREGFTE